MPMTSSLALPRVADSPMPPLPALVWPTGRGLLARSSSDGLPPFQRRAVTGLIVLAHALTAWALFNARSPQETPEEVHGAPMFVSMIAPAAPAAQPKPVARVMPKAPKPVAKPLVAAPSPRPAVFQAPAVAEVRQPTPAPAPFEKAVEAAPSVAAAPEVSAAPAPAPAPLNVPSSAVQYLQKTNPDYPAASRRLGETGKVLVSVVIDEAGLPHDVKLNKSSSYSRLDEAAMASVRQWRFKPYMQNGKPMSVRVNIPLDFDLD